jgi:uncharacterized tellurite resistance protein B-like protein
LSNIVEHYAGEVMIRRIQRFFSARIQSGVQGGQQNHERALQLATAALLIEVTRADFHVEQSERRAVISAVQALFELSRQETDELVALAEEEVDGSVSLFQFTQLVDQEFSQEQKAKVIEMMWRVAFADLDKDKYEEYLVRKVADLLHVPHSIFTRTRHKVQTELANKLSGPAR